MSMQTQSTQAEVLGQQLTLPCGAVLCNRFMKSAMSETLGGSQFEPTSGLSQLYQTWSEGGTGLLISGNVMIDSRHRGEPNNVVVENERDLAELKHWAKAGTVNGNHFWMQLNHPGKQTPSVLQKQPVAPSAIELKIPSFNKPRALTEPEIAEIINRFSTSAAIAQKAGFTGVQLHCAHGYLISQFLSPHHNQRTDQWGGSLENRMRFLLETYKAIRTVVGPDFPIGIKLNSADFQKGGFSNEDSLEVIRAIADIGIDLVEISGGTYEAPAMVGQRVRESTKQREAYFLVFAEQVRKLTNVPLVVTGGFRSSEGMMSAMESGALDVIGLARPLTLHTDIPNRLLRGEQFTSPVKPFITTGIKTLDKMFMLDITWYEQQIHRIAQGKLPKPNLSPLLAGLSVMRAYGLAALRKRRA